MADGARLESVYTLKRIVGSNPTSSDTGEDLTLLPAYQTAYPVSESPFISKFENKRFKMCRFSSTFELYIDFLGSFG